MGRQQPLACDGQGDAAGVDGDPPPAPLLGDVGPWCRSRTSGRGRGRRDQWSSIGSVQLFKRRLHHINLLSPKLVLPDRVVPHSDRGVRENQTGYRLYESVFHLDRCGRSARRSLHAFLIGFPTALRPGVNTRPSIVSEDDAFSPSRNALTGQVGTRKNRRANRNRQPLTSSPRAISPFTTRCFKSWVSCRPSCTRTLFTEHRSVFRLSWSLAYQSK